MSNNYIECGWRRAWIMWDLDNGHAWSKGDPGRGYLWVFKTKKEAIEHKRQQRKMEFGAKLSKPFLIEGDRSILGSVKSTVIRPMKMKN